MAAVRRRTRCLKKEMPTTKDTKDTKLGARLFALGVLNLAFAFTVATTTTMAQCAMCKTNIAGAENAAEVSSAINSGVLVLLIPTLAIIGGVIRLVFKYRN